MEVVSTMIVSMLEASALSFYPLHERPDQRDLKKSETLFRGDSSFPSGHVMTYYAIALKTHQYFGLKYALAPYLATFITARERIASKKHFFSDVVGAIFLTYWAHRGVLVSLSDESLSLGFQIPF